MHLVAAAPAPPARCCSRALEPDAALMSTFRLLCVYSSRRSALGVTTSWSSSTVAEVAAAPVTSTFALSHFF